MLGWGSRAWAESHASWRVRRGSDWVLGTLFWTQWTTCAESGGRATTSATLSFSPSGEPGAVGRGSRAWAESHASRRVRRGSDWVRGTLFWTQWTTYAESGGRMTTSATLSFSPSGQVFQERNRKPVSGNRFPVSLLKYLSNRVRIVAKTIG